MNERDDKVGVNSAQNYLSNEEDSILKQFNSSSEKDGVGDNSAPSSSELIVTEPSKDLDKDNISKDLNGVDATINEKQDDLLIGNHKENVEESIEKKLSQTVCLLETEWGSKVYLVGTAHFSEESQEDVAKVIRAVQPNFVVLELCESRSYMLKWEEDEILKIADKMEFKMMKETILMYGVFQGLMYLLLLSISAQITRQLGMAPGGEFRRAYKEAANVPGCVIHLGDRPIEITLRRAFASLSWWQSIKFAFYVIFSKKNIDEEDIEKCKNRDSLEEMLALLGGKFPNLKKVFVNERDLFLSYSLLNATMLSTGPEGIVPNTVVGVVGMGHVAGIQRNWGVLDPIELRGILQIPPPSKTSKVLKFVTKASILCLAIYGVHKLASKSQFYSSFFR